MERLVACLVLLVCCSKNLVISQTITYNTIPDTDSGVPAYVFANEGTENVQLYCEVIRNDMNVQTRWLIKRQNDLNFAILTFDVNGTVSSSEHSDLIGKIEAIGEPISQTLQFQTNFTIINFTSEFDLSQIKCGPDGAQLREFNLGLPGIFKTLLTLR